MKTKKKMQIINNSCCCVNVCDTLLTFFCALFVRCSNFGASCIYKSFRCLYIYMYTCGRKCIWYIATGLSLWLNEFIYIYPWTSLCCYHSRLLQLKLWFLSFKFRVHEISICWCCLWNCIANDLKSEKIRWNFPPYSEWSWKIESSRVKPASTDKFWFTTKLKTRLLQSHGVKLKHNIMFQNLILLLRTFHRTLSLTTFKWVDKWILIISMLENSIEKGN